MPILPIGVLPTRSTGGAIYRCSVDFDVDVMGSSRALPSWNSAASAAPKGTTTTEGSGKLSWPVPRGGLPTAGNWPGVGTRRINCCSRCWQQQPRQQPRDAAGDDGRWTRLLCVCAAAQRRVLSPGGLVTCWPRRECVGEEGSGDLRPPPLTKMRLKNKWFL